MEQGRKQLGLIGTPPMHARARTCAIERALVHPCTRTPVQAHSRIHARGHRAQCECAYVQMVPRHWSVGALPLQQEVGAAPAAVCGELDWVGGAVHRSGPWGLAEHLALPDP